MTLVERLVKLYTPGQCALCNRPNFSLCVDCQKTYFAGEKYDSEAGIHYVSLYTKPAQMVVKRLKFKYERGLAKEMSGQLPHKPADVICHVPTVHAHIRSRGFDHAELLAKSYARSNQQRHLPVLRRVRQSRQVGSSRRQRIEHMQGAFEVRLPHLVRDKVVVLVDDVYSTGATMNSARQKLIEAGAASVQLVVFAFNKR